ncbi:MAG: ribosome hibernation-promoting factor, HPF/YfiA family [bacterium JZ-2024 1]
MQVIITSSNAEISEDNRNEMEKKFHKLARFFDRILRLELEVRKEKNGFRVEATAELPRLIVRAENTGKQLQSVIDLVYRKLQRQIQRYKKFLLDRKRQAVAPAVSSSLPAQEEIPPFHPEVVRRKLLDLKPMTEDEAALQMELLGHDFFIFLNEKNNRVNVIYKRKDGNYGLIESVK